MQLVPNGFVLNISLMQCLAVQDSALLSCEMFTVLPCVVATGPATWVPTICAAMCRPPLPPSVVEMFGDDVQLVDRDEGEITVDIVVGFDVYWRLMSTEVITLPLGLVAQRSVFGWIVLGSLVNLLPSIMFRWVISYYAWMMFLNPPSDSLGAWECWDLWASGIWPSNGEFHDDCSTLWRKIQRVVTLGVKIVHVAR